MSRTNQKVKNPILYKAGRVNHQFRLRTKQANGKKAIDGTVDNQFLVELYHKTDCRYCKCGIMPDLRTIDHIHPIYRGGHHTKYNLDMACYNCNTNKQCLTEEEYLALRHSEKKRKNLIKKVTQIVSLKNKIIVELRKGKKKNLLTKV